MEQRGSAARANLSDGLLLALIFALPLMNPTVHGPIVAADLLFVLLAAVLAVELVLRRRQFVWVRGFGVLLIYVAALAPSLLASSNIGASLLKMATEFYLIGLAALTGLLIDSELKLRRAVVAWLAATAIVCADGILSLAAFVTGQASWLLDYSNFGFGSLPPGNYPRLSLTFLNANMACNYLTVSLALLLLARVCGYVGRMAFRLMLAGIAIASISTISPGLGGIALLAGIWLWVVNREYSPRLARLALLAGAGIAALFIVALAVTPVAHSTAPFAMRLPAGITIYPSGRFLTWSAAFEQFARHPLIGIGIGIDPVDVRFADPSGNLQQLTDAHNLFLSIAAQCGVSGLIGLAAIIAFAVRCTRSPFAVSRRALPSFLLGAAFLDGLVYQGIGGSFEDARHLWVLLGLMIAASRLELSPSGGRNRRRGAPSPG